MKVSSRKMKIQSIEAFAH